MNPNTPSIKYNYEFFLFTQLAKENYLTQTEDMEYEHMFVVLIDLYEDFLKSDFNDTSKKWHESMSQYLANLIG